MNIKAYTPCLCNA